MHISMAIAAIYRMDQKQRSVLGSPLGGWKLSEPAACSSLSLAQYRLNYSRRLSIISIFPVQKSKSFVQCLPAFASFFPDNR